LSRSQRQMGLVADWAETGSAELTVCLEGEAAP
jgi:hypothetical protein